MIQVRISKKPPRSMPKTALAMKPPSNAPPATALTTRQDGLCDCSCYKSKNNPTDDSHVKTTSKVDCGATSGVDATSNPAITAQNRSTPLTTRGLTFAGIGRGNCLELRTGWPIGDSHPERGR